MLKRSQSSSTAILVPSSSSEQSIASLPQTKSSSRRNKMRRSSSHESIVTILLDSTDEDKENKPPPMSRGGIKKSSSSSSSSNSRANSQTVTLSTTSSGGKERDPLSSSTELNQLADPMLFKLSKPLTNLPPRNSSNSGFQEFINSLIEQDFPRTSTTLNAAAAASLPKQTSNSKPKTKRRRRKESSSASSTTSTDTITEYQAPSSPRGSISRSVSSESLHESIGHLDDDIDEVMNDSAELDHEEEEEHHDDKGTMPEPVTKDIFFAGTIDTLLYRFSKPESALRVQHNSRTLENAAFFELLMSVRAIDLAISRMYPVNAKTSQVKQSLVDLQERLFGKTGKINLSQLTKCVLMDAGDHAKLRGRDAEASNYYLDLVKYLIEIFVYMETLAFLRFRVFDMKLQELYEASSGNLPAYLAMVVKLKQPMQQNQMDREPFKDLNLVMLNEQKTERTMLTNREYLKKHELAARLLDRQIRGSEETDTLVEQLQSVENLNQLDPSGKVQVIKQLVDLIMFDGINYRAYINDLALKKVETAKDMKTENEKLKETEAKYEFSRPVEVDKDESDDQEDSADRQQDADEESANKENEPAEAEEASKLSKLHPNTRKKYLRELSKYRKLEKTFQETKYLLDCVVRSEPACSISATTDSDIRHLNLWSFDNLMPNYLIVESTKQEFTSGESKSSWFQVNDVNEFTRSLKILLPAAEFNKINRSITKLNNGGKKPSANTGLDTAKPVSLDFLSRLTEFQATLKHKRSAIRTKKRTVNEDDDDDEVPTNSQLVADSFADADRIIKSLQDLYERLLASNLHRWKATNDQLQGERTERYEIEIGEEFIKLTKEWPNLVAELKTVRSRAGKAGLDPASKEELLSTLTAMCQILLDSFHQDTKALNTRFFGNSDLGSVLHDYALVHCSTFQFLDLFVTVLKHNIQWEHSLENTECRICHETRIQDGSLVDNTKIQCTFCSACFHYGCLTYEEDESKITFFEFKKSIRCSACIVAEEKLIERQLKKNLEVESVDVNDYKLRANRARVNYSESVKVPRKAKRAESTSGSSANSWETKRSKKKKAEDSFLVEDSEDEEGSRSKKKSSKRVKKEPKPYRESRRAAVADDVPRSTRSLRPRKDVNYNLQASREDSK